LRANREPAAQNSERATRLSNVGLPPMSAPTGRIALSIRFHGNDRCRLYSRPVQQVVREARSGNSKHDICSVPPPNRNLNPDNGVSPALHHQKRCGRTLLRHPAIARPLTRRWCSHSLSALNTRRFQIRASAFAPKTFHHCKHVGVAVAATTRQVPVELSGPNEKGVSTAWVRRELGSRRRVDDGVASCVELVPTNGCVHVLSPAAKDFNWRHQNQKRPEANHGSLGRTRTLKPFRRDSSKP